MSRRSRWPSRARRCRNRSARVAALRFRSPRSDRFSSGSASCERAEKVLLRALESRGQTQFNEITGAVYDTLAQIALMRGGYESAGDYLRQAGEAYGSYGAQTGLWYEWSIRVLEAKLAARRGATEEALQLAERNRRQRAAGRGHSGGSHCVRSAARGRPRARCRSANRERGHPHRRARHAWRVGRVPSAAGSAARSGRPPVRGVPRHRAERERVRVDRRGVSGRA